MDPDTWLTAVHEAAHVVVALHCGVPVLEASTVANGDILGFIVPGEIPEADTVRKIHDKLAILYAGGVAESMLFGAVSGAGDDLRIIEVALKGFPAEFGISLKQMAFSKTKAVVRDRREDILWFADELYKRRLLDRAQIEQLWKTRNELERSRLRSNGKNSLEIGKSVLGLFARMFDAGVRRITKAPPTSIPRR